MPKPSARPLILASRSPRRRLLLKQIGLDFVVHPSSVDERFHDHESPRTGARRVAEEKAMDVARSFGEGIVVGADTIVVVGTEVLGKPKTEKEARGMLRKLSGRAHVVYTAIALVDVKTRKKISEVVRTKVQFRTLTENEIARYVASGSPMDKAGAYGIQDDYGAVFVEKVEGCFYNVVGFPLSRFHRAYQKFLRELH